MEITVTLETQNKKKHVELLKLFFFFFPTDTQSSVLFSQSRSTFVSMVWNKYLKSVIWLYILQKKIPLLRYTVCMSTCTEIVNRSWHVTASNTFCLMFAMSLLLITEKLHRLFLQGDIYTSPAIEKWWWGNRKSIVKLCRDLFCVSSGISSHLHSAKFANTPFWWQCLLQEFLTLFCTVLH